ncbi:hypothetical protein CN378_11900 [Bacillus sp. AFS015802]|uniref:hypothetical protein n=1 Tax=Bacillus sp. AFS015802 TaxID=2033486 RepID=UPI000BF69E50|nr:hypothetical protein [Bacillus sp. AFS015802]PFA67074.1 hypothetical protein CN378_11900 [Bacillus sp. AFS015802]
MSRLMFVMLLCMMVITNPFQQQTQQSDLPSFDEVATISDHLLLTDASVILDAVPSLVHKQDGIPPNKMMIPPDQDFDLKPLAISPIFFKVFPDSLGFLEVVRSQSNYLITLHS